MKYQVRKSFPLAETQFNGDDDQKKKKTKSNHPLTRGTKEVPYTMKDLTAEQRNKINSINLSPSAKQKAINAFAKENN